MASLQPGRVSQYFRDHCFFICFFFVESNKDYEGGINATSVGNCTVGAGSGAMSCGVPAGRVHTAGRALLAVECGSRRVPFVLTLYSTNFSILPLPPPPVVSGGGVVVEVTKVAVYTATATSSTFSLLRASGTPLSPATGAGSAGAGAGASAASGGLSGGLSLSPIAEALDGWMFWLQMQAVLELTQVSCRSCCCECVHWFSAGLVQVRCRSSRAAIPPPTYHLDPTRTACV